MRFCPRCGALFLARVVDSRPYDSRTYEFEPTTCHCSVDPDPEAPYDSGETLHDLSPEQRKALWHWLAAYEEGTIAQEP